VAAEGEVGAVGGWGVSVGLVRRKKSGLGESLVWFGSRAYLASFSSTY